MSQGPEAQDAPAPAPQAVAISPPRTSTSTPSAPPAPPRNTAGSVLSNALLMLFGAILAGGGYFLARAYAPPQPPRDVASSTSGGVLPDDFKALVARVDALNARVEGDSKKNAQPQGTDPDFKKLRDKLEDVARAQEDVGPRFEIVEKRIETALKDQAAPTGRIDDLDRRVVDLKQAVDSLKANPAARPSTAAGPGPAGANLRAIEKDVELFKQGKYPEADAAFARLRAESADDARVWYFSALAHGLATRQWLGETERLVLAGLEREKAGSPPIAEIDASLAGLTAANGKEWVAAYRKRIGPR